MIQVNGINLDFDITCPDDLRRYANAMHLAEEADKSLPAAPASVATKKDFEQYIEFCTGFCKMLTDFIDTAFGDGTCDKLLGSRTSMETLFATYNALGAAVEKSGETFGIAVKTYMPNRATRRANT